MSDFSPLRMLMSRAAKLFLIGLIQNLRLPSKFKCRNLISTMVADFSMTVRLVRDSSHRAVYPFHVGSENPGHLAFSTPFGDHVVSARKSIGLR